MGPLVKRSALDAGVGGLKLFNALRERNNREPETWPELGHFFSVNNRKVVYACAAFMAKISVPVIFCYQHEETEVSVES